MTWMSFYCAPVVFATMVPFWFLLTLWQGTTAGLPVREAARFSVWYAPVAAMTVWVLLFVLLGGVLGGIYSW